MGEMYRWSSRALMALLTCAAALGMTPWSMVGTPVRAETPPIAARALLDHVRLLAADDLRGRANGSPELERAADYIAAAFRQAGLTPGGVDGTFFQPFALDAGLTVGAGNTLTLSNGRREVSLTLGKGYYPLSVPPNDDPAVPSVSLTGTPLVFAGYGISAPGLRYDDYTGVSVAGKAVIVFSHEPQETNRFSRFNGSQPIPESSLYAKALAARSRGARALLVVSDPVHAVDQANYRVFGVVPDADDFGIPVLRVHRDEIAPLLLGWGLDQSVRQIDGDLVPRPRELTGATVQYQQFLARDRRTVRNVVGILPARGASPSDEAVVIGAHYDHVGLGGRFSMSPERTGEIHNGADDNASGTASVIEMARAAAADPSRFGRALIFVAFAGEERGLLGSRHYVDAPARPLAGTVAMINLDMVGRSRGAVDVSGLDTSPSLESDLALAARAAGGITVRQEGPGGGRSDDSSFLDRRIPAINFFTGFHGDYHRPGDDWQRIDAEGTARIATLALELVARIAARPDRPEFVSSR